jgi:hypothetical protein
MKFKLVQSTGEVSVKIMLKWRQSSRLITIMNYRQRGKDLSNTDLDVLSKPGFLRGVG